MMHECLCLLCNKTFISNRKGVKYCDGEHKRKCEKCGEYFLLSRYKTRSGKMKHNGQQLKRKFCSRDCCLRSFSHSEWRNSKTDEELEAIKNKVKETNLMKYGVSNAKNSEVLKKDRETRIRNGNQYDLSEELMHELYIVNNFSIEEMASMFNIGTKTMGFLLSKMGLRKDPKMVYKNVKKTWNKKYENIQDRYDCNRKNIKHIEQWKHLGQWAVSFKENKGRKPTSKDVSDFFGVHKDTLFGVDIENKRKLFAIGESYWEAKVSELFAHKKINNERRNRSILKPQELDFLLLDYNLAIEVNDVATHNSTNSVFAGKTKRFDYHQNKTKACWEKGIRLIHIWQWDIESGDYEWIIQHFLDNPDLQPEFGKPSLMVVDGLDCWDDGVTWQNSQKKKKQQQQ